MKSIIFVLIFALSINLVGAQESTLDKVAKEVCAYFNDNTDELKGLSKADLTAKLGVQMIQRCLKYKEELKQDGFEFDISKGREEGKKIGAKIGVSMIKFCPDVLMSLAGKKLDEEIEDKKEQKNDDYTTVKGKIKKFTGKEIFMLELKDEGGKTQKFVWLSNFEGSDILLELGYDKAKGKTIQLHYDNIEIFSPKFREYIIRKRIKKIEFLD